MTSVQLLAGGSPPPGSFVGGGPPPGLYRITPGDATVSRTALHQSGRIRSIVFDTSSPDTVYVATTRDGVLRSDDTGETWHAMNEGLTYKEVWSLVQHPTTGALLAGTQPAAIFTSDDGAESWHELQSMRMLPTAKEWTFPAPPFTAHVKQIAVSLDAPDLIMAAVEEGWLVRTDDAGATWENVVDGTDFDSHAVHFAPGDPTQVLSIAGGGVFRSDDGGRSFGASMSGLERRYTTAWTLPPDASDPIFLTVARSSPGTWRGADGADAALYRSDDLGRSWVKTGPAAEPGWRAAPLSMAQDPDDRDSLFVGMSDGTVLATVDGGTTFDVVARDLPSVSALAVVARADSDG